uniref:Uncharacterized protein n=1 Tax=Varanus komodoensis TaxID=61221 RepID=A0A8D2IHS1_VARKO
MLFPDFCPWERPLGHLGGCTSHHSLRKRFWSGPTGSRTVNGVHPECRFHLEILEEEIKCQERLKNAKRVGFKGETTACGVGTVIRICLCVVLMKRNKMVSRNTLHPKLGRAPFTCKTVFHFL